MNWDETQAPDAWQLRTLGELTSNLTDGTHAPPPREPSGMPLLSAKDVEDDGLAISDQRHVSEEFYRAELARTRLAVGDVLLTIVGSIGRSTVIENAPEYAFQRSVAILKPTNINPYFLSYYLRSPQAFSFYAEHGRGTAQQGIYLTQLQRMAVPVPSLDEQEHVVSIIRRALDLRGSSAAHLRTTRRAIERFKQAVLAAACSGRLTANWRDGHRLTDGAETVDVLPDGWSPSTLGELSSSIRGGSTEVPSSEPTEYPVLRSSSVRPFEVDFADVRYLTEDKSQREANFLTEGDLLITRLSGSLEYVGNCAVVKDLGTSRIQYPDRLFRCRLLEPQESPFVELAFAGPEIRAQIEAASRSAAGHQRISIADLKGFHLARPPLDEQREIVRRVSALFALAESVRQKIEDAQGRVERSSQAILAKAFRGGLV